MANASGRWTSDTGSQSKTAGAFGGNAMAIEKNGSMLYVKVTSKA